MRNFLTGILAGLVLLAACAFCDTVGAERHTGNRGKPAPTVHDVSWTALKVAADSVEVR